MSVNWTEEQQKVISLRNRSMLVSAAAGSGKTAVLVERIISMITDREQPLDIDRLLVVTFTKAAAAEMRERVGNAIEQALREHPSDRHLQRQLTLIHNAQITTIDSFCNGVLRSHFHRIGLEPGFRIADEGERKLLEGDVCDQVLEEFYASENPLFLRFVESYSDAKSDARIREMILSLYRYSVSYPWPQEWLAECVKQYEIDGEEELEQKPWAQDFLSYLRVRISELLRRHRELYAVTQEEDGPYMYAAAIRDDLRQLEEALQAEHFSQWQQALDGIRFKTIASPAESRKFRGSEEKKEAVALGRERMKEQIKKIRKEFPGTDLQTRIGLLGKTGEMVRMLVELTRAFGERLAQEKAQKNLLDFSDVEHLALRVLVDPETKEPTETAAEYREQFAEVMIDEYQDSNYVQEALLTAVSGLPEGRENLFMVGDVKQSIYRFRLARPELFMEKYRSFSTADGARQRVDLHRNFRSRTEVVDTVNAIFSRIMGADLGNVEYDSEAALCAGAEFPEYRDPAACATELILIPSEKGEDKKQAEARTVAQRIRELVEQEEIPGIRYRDIAILLRSLSGWSESFQKAFEQEGIPLIVSSRTGYFTAGEVQTVLALLRVLDNPRQDIPLTAVLKSHFGGFTAEELARMRTACPDLPFYQCVMRLADAESADVSAPEAEELAAIREKLRVFRDWIRDLRSRVPYTPIHLLLQEIYDESGYRSYVSALPAGEQRRANLDMLLEKAIAYEKTSYHGLFHFIRYIDRLMKYDVDYGEAEIVSEQENAVRLTTIHKSKGLEYPVVFVSGMGKQFNRQDYAGSMVFHPEYGVGLKWYDSEKRVKSDTLIRQIFALEAKKETMGEELRILYVALTRAREKLILTGTGELPAEHAHSRENVGEKLDFSDRLDAKCYWDWVLPALRDMRERYPVRVRDAQSRAAAGVESRVSLAQTGQRIREELETVEEKDYTKVDRRLSWTYPHAGSGRITQKVSVSELKHRAIEEARKLSEEPEEAALFPNEIPIPYVPKFVEETPENAGALYGTAVHRFFECLDFARLPHLASRQEAQAFVGDQLERLIQAGRMTAEDAGRLNLYQISGFLETDTAVRMREAAREGLLTKERPFVMSVSADEVLKGAAGEDSVLVQGIIDVFWEEADGIMLLDYKTDRVDTPEELAGRYQRQLLLYAQALAGSFPGTQVKEILIYSFCLEKVISID